MLTEAQKREERKKRVRGFRSYALFKEALTQLGRGTTLEQRLHYLWSVIDDKKGWGTPLLADSAYESMELVIRDAIRK